LIDGLTSIKGLIFDVISKKKFLFFIIVYKFPNKARKMYGQQQVTLYTCGSILALIPLKLELYHVQYVVGCAVDCTYNNQFMKRKESDVYGQYSSLSSTMNYTNKFTTSG
jgi:hypothetical protein